MKQYFYTWSPRDRLENSILGPKYGLKGIQGIMACPGTAKAKDASVGVLPTWAKAYAENLRGNP